MTKFGICFSRDFEGDTPLAHIGKKLPVYLRLLEFCQKEGWETYVLTRKTYQGGSEFEGAWLYENNEFLRVRETLKIDIIYDRTGGVNFPPKGLANVVNQYDFKVLCWDKWKAYRKFTKYMPKTVWIGKDFSKLKESLDEIKTDRAVVKPFNGLKGIDVFIGSKNEVLEHEFSDKEYILQEFVDTSKGIPNITNGLHDLRVAIVNGKIVWCHVRVPVKGTFLANAAQGGNLTEVDIEKIPESVRSVVEAISLQISSEFDNPTYSLDFGLEKGEPKVFEINDQIGFPTWEMKNRDLFLNELVQSFKFMLK